MRLNTLDMPIGITEVYFKVYSLGIYWEADVYLVKSWLDLESGDLDLIPGCFHLLAT